MNITPNIYYKTILQYREAQILFEAIKLDIFSYLDKPITLEEISKITNYNRENLNIFLMALSSCGYIEKNDLTYCNTVASKVYLSKNSKKYIGQAILFREKMGSILGIENRVRYGFTKEDKTYNFSELAEVVHHEMYATGRVYDFNIEIKQIFSNPCMSYKVLDLGGGSGVLAIEFVKNFPNSVAYVFETPEVALTTKKIIKQNNMENYISVLEGDFNVDDIGKDYDLIIASGIFNFVSVEINKFINKIADSLLPNGYLLIIGSFLENDEYPKEHILNWIRGYMNGVKPTPTEAVVEEAMDKANFKLISPIKVGLFQGSLYKMKS